MRAKRTIDMVNGPLFSNVVRFTVPIILSSILQLLFNAADLVVVGQLSEHKSLSVAAVGATNSITNLTLNIFIGLSVGAGVAVAQAIGARRDTDVHDTVHTAIPTAVAAGLILTAIGVIFAPTFLTWMGTPEEIIGLSTVYMRIYFCGMTSSMLYNYGAAILRAAGDTKSPLVYLTIAGVANVILNVIFVWAFHMDVAGVALATALTQTLSAVLILRALIRRTDACRLDLRKLRFKKAVLLRMVQIGLPAGVQGSLFDITNVMIQSSINAFGTAMVSGNSASGSITAFTYVAMNAFHQTSLNFVGQNIGAGRRDRIPKITGMCLLCVFVTGAALGGLTALFGRPLLGIYITDNDAAIEQGMIKLLIISLPYFLNGLMDVMTGSIRGMGYSTAPMIVTVVGVCGIRVVWLNTVFRAVHTPFVLFMSYPVTWCITFIAELILFFVLIRRKPVRKHFYKKKTA